MSHDYQWFAALLFYVCHVIADIDPYERYKKKGFTPAENEEVATYENSSEVLARYLASRPKTVNYEIVTDAKIFSPDPKRSPQYTFNFNYTTLDYEHVERSIRRHLHERFPEPDLVNLTFVKALFVPLTKPKLVYRVLLVSNQFENMTMNDRLNMTTRIIDEAVVKHHDQYKHEKQCFMFTHEEWSRKRSNYMQVFSTLFHYVKSTGGIIMEGKKRRKRKRRGITYPMFIH